MRKKLKLAIQQEFSPPPPEKKEEFLRRLPAGNMGWGAFLLTQAGYLGKGNWILSALVFAAALAGSRWWGKDGLVFLGACMPLLALTLVTESGRSERYGMAEFEQSSRFSLRGVLLARLSILGAVNFLVFCLVLPLVGAGRGWLERAVYLACPYLLTACLGLEIVRRQRGKEGFYLCILAALGVSMGGLMMFQCCPKLYDPEEFFWWVAALGLLTLGTGKECVIFVKQKEEAAWNL